ncbi:MAG TPA: M3 family metallopeptidase [Candidatus Ozemobacteraceae bacterium]
MRLWITIALFVAPLAVFAAEPSFDPLPGTARTSYRFDLKQYFSNEAAWKAEMEKARTAAAKLESFKGKVLADAKTLYQTMEAKRALQDIQDRLYAYASFKRAINTNDRAVYEAQEKLDAEISARTSFLKVELKSLTEEKLKEFRAAEKGLDLYGYYLEDIARFAPHLLSEEKESVLSVLTPDLTSWQSDLFQRVFDRFPFPQVISEGKKLNVHIDFEGLMRSPDRKARERAFRLYYDFFRRHADMLAFALRREMKTLNTISGMRGFPTYYHQALFGMYMSRPEIDAMYAQLEKYLPLYHKYQNWRIASLERELGGGEVGIWDIELTPAAAKPARLTIDQGCAHLNAALEKLGTEYSTELKKLLEPKNGRLDVVGGPNRDQGAFCVGNFGYFMDNFQGFLNDVSTLAHESGHAIHYQLVKNKRGSLMFAEGPAFMTESFAMFNEWMLRDHLVSTLKDPAVIAGIRWDMVNEMMYLWELARRAKFEMISYDRIASGEIVDENGFNKACTDVGKQYDIFFAKHPELEYHWMRKHHYWSVPGYYVNYVVAHMLALKYYSMYKADPAGFAPKYVAMVSNGFDRPATALLKDFLDISLEDPNLLKGVCDLISKRFDELKSASK